MSRLCTTALLVAAVAAHAQTLARPGWAGSGLAAEAWWHSAVFYRVDVRHFQDSNADGTGDLRGLASRLDYVQSLGVDAVVLLLPFDDAGFDDLLREASGRHIRLVVAMPASGDAPQILAAARQWLTRGAAGIYLQRATASSAPLDTTALLRDLRTLVDTFPGQRVVLSEFAPGISLRTKGQRQQTAELIDVQIISGNDVLRREMSDTQGSSGGSAESAALLLTDARFRSANAYYAADSAEQLGRNKILATVLLSFRGAVSLRYGQELGLAAEAGGADPATMQWTPANVATVPVEPVKPNPAVFGAYVPYVPPKKAVGKPVPDIVADANLLRGFTSGSPSEAPGRTNRQAANVALEDADPNSLLNFYRRLVQLHHGNSSIRNGVPSVLDHEYESALVWVRHAPVGARTAGNVVVACNLGDTPLTLSLHHDLERLHIRSGTLRPLLASWTESPSAQSSDQMVLPPYSVFVGELFHDGR